MCCCDHCHCQTPVSRCLTDRQSPVSSSESVECSQIKEIGSAKGRVLLVRCQGMKTTRLLPPKLNVHPVDLCHSQPNLNHSIGILLQRVLKRSPVRVCFFAPCFVS